jgi:hypothetical protein
MYQKYKFIYKASPGGNLSIMITNIYKTSCRIELFFIELLQRLFYKLVTFENARENIVLHTIEWTILKRAMLLDAVVHDLPIENVQSFYQELKNTFY